MNYTPRIAAVMLLAALGHPAPAPAASGALHAGRGVFKAPQRTEFRMVSDGPAQGLGWLAGYLGPDSDQYVEFGSRLVLELCAGVPPEQVLDGSLLKVVRCFRPGLFLVEAPDAHTAVEQSQRLSGCDSVLAAYPVMRREATPSGAYAARPNDPHFPSQLANVQGQWYLENRNLTNGASLGPDLNVRSAWPWARGNGVTIAIVDVGVELRHRELTNAAAGAPHHHFGNGSGDGTPAGTSAAWAHGTAAAGLAVAAGDNRYGMVGVAPMARLASWVVFTNTSRLMLVGEDRMAEMYQFASETVGIQSFSWNFTTLTQTRRPLLEDAAIEAAWSSGRGGRGTVLCRGAGNQRAEGGNANDDGYAADPRVIVVAAVNRTGRAASYSEPGACVLVAAPSGDTGQSGLFTTDLTGTAGFSAFNFLPPFDYLSDFAFNSFGFSGTSAATPLVAGTAALILSANPELTARDVQQILILSARHFDPADPDLVANGAGLLVSHNDGYGVPDAGQAVRLARNWNFREPASIITVNEEKTLAIPDDGLRLRVTGAGVPSALSSIRCLPGTGPHADAPTASLPLVDVGLATNVIATNLSGKAALIARGTNNFDEKILRAAQAGAAFAVIYNYPTPGTAGNCPGGDQLCPLGATDFTPIPAVFIRHSDGIALKELFSTNTQARAQLRLQHADCVLTVTNALLTEHVGVRVRTDHPLRGDLRITLVSPSGTRSVLQRYNGDRSAGPVDWTYYSTHHFLEPSRGNWRVEFSDESAGFFGNVLSVGLSLHGVAITDADADGLDDAWEQTWLGTLAYLPSDDPDNDGYSNAREQVMATDPTIANEVFSLDLEPWDARLARLSWPGVDGQRFEIWSGSAPGALTFLTNAHGRFPESEWFTPVDAAHRFFRVRRTDP